MISLCNINSNKLDSRDDDFWWSQNGSSLCNFANNTMENNIKCCSVENSPDSLIGDISDVTDLPKVTTEFSNLKQSLVIENSQRQSISHAGENPSSSQIGNNMYHNGTQKETCSNGGDCKKVKMHLNDSMEHINEAFQSDEKPNQHNLRNPEESSSQLQTNCKAVSSKVQHLNKSQSHVEVLDKKQEDNKLSIKRLSGAQRRKRKWRRLEMDDLEPKTNTVQNNFAKLSINDNIGDRKENEKSLPCFSREGSKYSNISSVNDIRKDYKFNKRHSIRTHSPKARRNYCPQIDVPRDNVQHNQSYISTTENKYDVVVVDETHPEGIITSEHISQVIDELTKKLLEICSEKISPIPRFQGYHLNRGILTVNCVDENSMNWLLNIKLPELWATAKLQIIQASEFDNLIRVTAFVPGPLRTNPEILKLLKFQNSEINTSKWRIFRRGQETSTGMGLVLGVDEKSLTVLQSMDMKPYYGLSRAKFYYNENHTRKSYASEHKVIPMEHHV